MSPDDDLVVARQLGRTPRGRCRVASRCAYGLPRVIAVAPSLEDGTRFPTTFWLTCPHLTEAVHALESRGEHQAMAERCAAGGAFAEGIAAADLAYRAARMAEGDGIDVCGDVGIAGQSDPRAIKCLHARLAALLAGIDDPVGAEVRELLGRDGVALDCPAVRCMPVVGAS